MQIASDAALGATGGAITLSNATLGAQSAFSSARPIALTGANAVSAGGNAVTLSGSITGAGSVAFAGGGSVTLSGTNLYSGGTTISGGTTLQIASDAALGATSGTLSLGSSSTSGILLALTSFNSARPIIVNAGGGTIDANGNTVTLTGQVTQIGELHTVGGTGGEVMLAGPSTVNNLSVDTGAMTNTGTVNANTAVSVASSGSLTNSGRLITGQFTDNGTASNSGIVTASTGATVASGAFLSNNGTLSSPSLTVIGTLRGTGIIDAPTSVTGKLAPGNSPGTLTFNATVRLTANATTEIDIDGTGTGTGAGNYSRIVVNGAGNSFVAAGTLAPLLRGITGSASNTFVPTLGQGFTIVTAAGGVSGTFASLTQPSGLAAGTALGAVYTPTEIELMVEAAGGLPTAAAGESHNATAVANLLNAGTAAGNGTAVAIATAISTLPGTSQPQALTEPSPAIYDESVMAARDTWYQVAGAVSDQLAARRGMAAAASTAIGPAGATFWTNALGQNTRVSTTGEPGYHTTVAGAVVGIDMPIISGVVAGFAMAGGDAQTIDDSGTAGGTSVQLVAYGGAQLGRFFVDGQAGYLGVDRTVRRNISFADASTSGNGDIGGGGIQLQGGMQLATRGWRIEPLLALTAIGLYGSAVTETEGGTYAEHVSGQSVGSMQSLAEFRAARAIAVTSDQPVLVNASLGWGHEFIDVTASNLATLSSVSTTSFAVTTAPTSRDTAQLAAGIDVPVSAAFSLYGQYRASVGARSSAQNITAGLRLAL